MTPIDYGDVCVNYDKAWFAEHGVGAADLARRPDQARRTRTCSSSRTRRRRRPGLAFLLATIAQYGEDGWHDYWKQLQGQRRRGRRRLGAGLRRPTFSGSGGQGRPSRIVVSYASSPPAEVVFARPAAHRRADGGHRRRRCFRQIEFAGVLAGTKHAAAARKLIDFMLTQPVPGGHAAADVRVPGAHGTRAARRCSRSTRSMPPSTR